MATRAQRAKVLGITMSGRDQFSPAVHRARRAAQVFARSARASFRVVARAARTVRNAIRAMLGPIGLVTAALGGLGAFALVRSFHRLAGQMDEIAKQARATGAAVESVQELGHVAELTGTSLELLVKSMQRVVRAVGEAEDGNKTYLDSMRELGLNIDELARQQPVEIFLQFAEAMGGLESNTTRVRIAMEIFGQRNLKILNLINSNVDQLRAMRDEAHELGVVVDRETLGLFERWIDAWTRIKAAVRGIRIAIAVEFLPVLLELAERAKEFFITRRGDIRRWAASAVAGLRFAAGAVREFAVLVKNLAQGTDTQAFGEVLSAIGDVALDVVAETTIAAINIIKNVFDALFRPLLDTIGLVGEQLAARFVSRFRDELKTIVLVPAEISAFIRSKLSPELAAVVLAIPALRPFVQFSEQDVKEINKAITDTVDKAAGVAEKKIMEVEGILGAAVNNAIDVVRDEVSQSGKAITDAIAGVKDAFAEFREQLAGIDSPAVQAFLLRLELLEIEFAAARASAELAAGALRRYRQEVEEATESVTGLSDAQRQVVEDLRRETEILRARGREREALQLQKQFADEVRARREALGDSRETQEAFAQWRLAREEQLVADLSEVQGGFLAGVGAGIREWQQKVSDTFQLGKEAAETLLDSMQRGFRDLFQGLLDGTRNWGDTFRDVARDILGQIGEIVARLAAIQITRLFFPSFGMAAGGVVHGEMVPVRQFASGGISGVVDRPTLVAIGEKRQSEAVVPLPDGRHIPVTMTGSPESVVEVNQTFVIQTLDSRGVRELLVEEQETIQGLVTKGLSSKRDMRETVKRIR